MRVHLYGDSYSEQFSKLLLQIGNGIYPEVEDKIKIIDELAAPVMTLEGLITKVHPDIDSIKEKSTEGFCERAILTPTNDQCVIINSILLKSFNEEGCVYKSIDAVVDIDEEIHYPVEFLMILKPPGLPNYILHLKVGSPIMLLRNSKPPNLCNGVRLQVKKLHKNLIEATDGGGCGRGKIVFIPRIPLIPSDYPFQ